MADSGPAREALELLTLRLQGWASIPRHPSLSEAQAQLARRYFMMMELANFFRGVAQLPDEFAGLGMLFYDALQTGVDAGKPGRRPDPSNIAKARAHVACALDLLSNHSGNKFTSRAAAAAYVVKKAPEVQRLCRPGTTAKTAVVHWLDALEEGTNSNDAAAAVWSAHRSFLKGESGQMPAERMCDLANFLLSEIAARASRMAPIVAA